MTIETLVNAQRLFKGLLDQKGSKPLARRMLAVEEAPGAAFEEYIGCLDISMEKETTRSIQKDRRTSTMST